MYRGSFTMLSFDAYSKVVLIEEQLGKILKRYYTAQVKPFVEDPEDVAVIFMSYLSKAIYSYRIFYDGSAQCSLAVYNFKTSASRSMNSSEHFRSSKHSKFNACKVIQLEGQLHDAICK